VIKVFDEKTDRDRIERPRGESKLMAAPAETAGEGMMAIAATATMMMTMWTRR
jgi:hypothetical protein